MHASDRLLDAIDRAGAPVCVGIDPVLDRLPGALGPDDASPGSLTALERIERFCLAVVEAVAGVVPCVKPQSACFERYGHAGMAALERVLAAADAAGLETILDAKRGDIGVSAEHYAEAAFGHGHTDWVTVNGYLGADGIQPFLRPERGAFVLVRTSNPGGDALQRLRLEDGRTIADAMADLVSTLGDRSIGEGGFSDLGAVVGATKPEDAARLRERMPRQIFLVPGFGAQGGGVADVLPCFNGDRRGAIVTASRSVLYAFEAGDPKWTVAIRAAAERLRDEIAIGLRAAE